MKWSLLGCFGSAPSPFVSHSARYLPRALARPSTGGRRCLFVALVGVCVLSWTSVGRSSATAVLAQDPEFASPAERLEELEKRVQKQQKRIRSLEDAIEAGAPASTVVGEDGTGEGSGADEGRKKKKKKVDKAEEADKSESLITLGGVDLRLGGKLELNFLKSENGGFSPLGAGGITQEPDPHLELQRFRLEPELDFNRHLRVRGQLDFRPTDGDTLLKELTARHRARPTWWFRSDFQIGLDDRFIRPTRRTKTLPLIGNAFWRDESVALTWQLLFGNARGATRGREDFEEDFPGSVSSAGTDAFGGALSAEGVGGDEEFGAAAFDFADNPGELGLILSLGQGYELAENEVGFDGARFNDLVQDNRELQDDLALREFGVGVSYRRSFADLGMLSLMGFYFNDEMRNSSITFLQGTAMTNRNIVTGLPISGYGNSQADDSHRYGATVDWFLPASTLFEGVLETRKRDGLRVLAQYIQAEDGDLERDGWFVQASYRFSFGKLLFDRYVRSLEPVARYGRLRVDTPLGRAANLPGTWDREALMVGGLLEVTSEVWFKIEYVFNDETTGGGSVDNDELLVQLLFVF